MDEDIYYYLVRPDSLAIWSNDEVRRRLDWYYKVMKGVKPPKYIVAKHVPIPGDIKSWRKLDVDSLYDLHNELRGSFIEILGKIRKGTLNLDELEEYVDNFLELKIEIVRRLVDPCRLCERKCMVNRMSGRRGVCGLDSTVRVSSAFLHMGEEAPLIPSGTIFFTGCSFKCVYCIDENEYLISRIDGLVKVLRLSELKDLFQSHHVEVLTPKGWRDVINILYRESNELYELETTRGRRIRLTPEHIIICDYNGKHKECRVSDVKIGDKLISISENNWISKNNVNDRWVLKINLIDEFIKNLPPEYLRKIYVKGVKPILLDFLKKNGMHYKDFIKKYDLEGLKYWMIYYDTIPIQFFIEIQNLVKEIKENIGKYYISMKKGVKYKLPVILNITPYLMRLLGYFIAEGNYGGEYNIVITNSSKDIQDDILRCIRAIFPGIKAKLLYEHKNKAPQITLSSKLLYLVFRYVFKIGRTASQKRFPWIIFNIPTHLVKEFLTAYSIGNSTLVINQKKKDAYIRFVTVSEGLKYDLIYLLGLNNIQYRIKRVRPKKSSQHIASKKNQFWIEVEGLYNLMKIEKLIDIYNISSNKAYELLYLMEKSKKIKKKLKGDFIKKIKVIKGKHKVYDLVLSDKEGLREEHTFYAGDGILIHNCQNWDISQRPFNGEIVGPDKLAKIAHILASRGARNINYVGGNPDQNMHVIIESLRFMNDWIPLLWNSNMYMTMESLELLLDIIDIWLPDFKYGNDECGFKLSRIENYFRIVSRNLSIVYNYGDEIIIRHLVLPNHIECCTKPVLKWIGENIPNVLVNIMDQYRPEHMVVKDSWRFKEINRRPYKREMDEAYGYAKKIGILYEPIS